MLFSIIIPSYNRAHLLPDLLNSLQQQTYPDFEAIVVDDGGSDTTREVVEKINDPRIRYVYKQNGERGAARNFGATLAKGDYINFFDSDDIAYPCHLQTAASMVEKHKNPEIFHFGYDMITPERKLIMRHNYFNGCVEKYAVRIKRLSINSIFLRRDIALQLPFSEARPLSASEDALWLCKLAARYTLHYDNTVTTAIINHNQRSMNTGTLEQIKNRRDLLIAGLKADDVFMKRYGSAIPFINAEMTYLMCISAFSMRNKKLGLRYFFASLKYIPLPLVKLRFGYLMKSLLT